MTTRRPPRSHRPSNAQGISVRGSTYDRLKAVATSHEIGTSELAQHLLAQSPALQMSAPDEYAMLERLVTRRRKAGASYSDLLPRMDDLQLGMTEGQRTLTNPPPKPKRLHQPVPVKPAPPRPQVEGSGYNEF